MGVPGGLGGLTEVLGLGPQAASAPYPRGWRAKVPGLLSLPLSPVSELVSAA